MARTDTLVITRRSSASAPTLSRASSQPAALPRVIVQLGDPRTATTLQFQSLCATMAVLHGNESDHVECGYNIQPWKKPFPPLDADGESRYYVIKTHEKDFAKLVLQAYAPGEVWVFVTTSNATSTNASVDDWQPSAKHAAEQLGMDVAHTQDTYALKLRGYMVVADYMYIFALSQNQSESLLQYVRYWSILRQCCGVQMSADQFAILKGQKATHHSPTSTAYPACHIYNLGAVESELVHSELMQSSAKLPGRLRKSSGKDDDFTGAYCNWFNRQVKCQDLSFNKVPQKPGC